MDKEDGHEIADPHTGIGDIIARIDALLAATGPGGPAAGRAGSPPAGDEPGSAQRTGLQAGEGPIAALAGGHAAVIDAIRNLLTGGLDTDEIAGFADLDDRRAALVTRLAATPARTAEDVLAKARAVVMRAALLGNDGIDPLARSLAEDIVALAQDGARAGRAGSA